MKINRIEISLKNKNMKETIRIKQIKTEKDPNNCENKYVMVV